MDTLTISLKHVGSQREQPCAVCGASFVPAEDSGSRVLSLQAPAQEAFGCSNVRRLLFQVVAWRHYYDPRECCQVRLSTERHSAHSRRPDREASQTDSGFRDDSPDAK